MATSPTDRSLASPPRLVAKSKEGSPRYFRQIWVGETLMIIASHSQNYQSDLWYSRWLCSCAIENNKIVHVFISTQKHLSQNCCDIDIACFSLVFSLFLLFSHDIETLDPPTSTHQPMPSKPQPGSRPGDVLAMATDKHQVLGVSSFQFHDEWKSHAGEWYG